MCSASKILLPSMLLLLSLLGRRRSMLFLCFASSLHTSTHGLIPAISQLIRSQSPGAGVLRRPILQHDVASPPPLPPPPLPIRRVDDDATSSARPALINVADPPHPVPTVGTAVSSPMDTAADTFETFVKMRTGIGDGPGSSPSVCWTGSGILYEAYSGKELAIFEGFDIARGVQLGPDRVRQFSRKLFWFRDATTGLPLTEHAGRPVRPIVYESQVIDYHRNGPDGKVTYTVESSSRDLRDLPKMEISSRSFGPSVTMINVPIFLDIPLPEMQRYRAWEFYDYVVDPSFPPDRPPALVWCRQGSMPPFNDDGGAVMRFNGHRVDTFEELPEETKRMVRKKFPLFQSPPMDE